MLRNVLVLLLGIFLSKINLVECKSDRAILSRHKRFAVFPDGSTWSLALCTTFQMTIPNNFGVWTEAINWGFSYNLPNSTQEFRKYLHPEHVSARRSRRDLYKRMEDIMDSMGYNGRSCILRALCDSAKTFLGKGNTIGEELLRIIFKFPMQKVMNWEPMEHNFYKAAYGSGQEIKECKDIYPDCPFSLIDVALNGIIDIGNTLS